MNTNVQDTKEPVVAVAVELNIKATEGVEIEYVQTEAETGGEVLTNGGPVAVTVH